jgi:hypothetical protein
MCSARHDEKPQKGKIMKQKNPHFLTARLLGFVSLIGAAMVSMQCFKQPLAPVAPNWDVQLSIPIADTIYFLRDALRGNPDIRTSGIFYEYRPTPYYFDPVAMGEISLDPPQTVTDTSNQLGLITIGSPPPISLFFPAPYSDTTIQPVPPPPAPCVVCFIPPFTVPESGDTIIGFRFSDDFDYVRLVSGSLSLTVVDSLPTSVTFLQPIEIRDRDNNPISTFNFGQVASNSSETQTNSLVNTRLTDSITVRFRLQVDTANLPATFVQNAGIQFRLQVNGPLQSNEARVNANPTVLVDTAITTTLVDDSTFVERVNFRRGKVKMTFRNNIDAGVRIRFKFREFVDKQELPYELRETIPRLARDSTEIDLTDYMIKSPVNSNAVTYEFEILTLEVSGFSTIYDTSSVEVRVEYLETPWLIREVTGRAKPFWVDFNDTIALPEIRLGSSFTADSILMNKDSLRISIQTAAGHPIDINASLVGVNDNGVAVANIRIPSGGSPDPNMWRFRPNAQNEILLTGGILNDFLRNFPGQQPRNLVLFGAGLVNPLDVYNNPGDPNHIGRITDTTNLYAGASFLVPLEVAIYNGEFRNTVLFGGDTSASGTQFDPNLLQSIREGNIFFALENTIPVNLKLKSEFYNQAGAVVLVPDSISITTAPGTQTTAFRLRPDQSAKFNESKRAVIRLQLGTGNQAAVFDTTQSIRVRMWANMKFNVNPNR